MKKQPQAEQLKSLPALAMPIDALYDEFKSAIKDNHLVVESDTGSGKSTRLPLWCAEMVPDEPGAGRIKRVLVVEPRRVACLALASFVGSQTDLAVGHAIRFDSTVTVQTQIAFVTPGIALRWLQEDGLAGFDTVIIDEFHERRWDTDLLLAMLKQKVSGSPDLRLVLTSATIDGERLTSYLSTNNPSTAQDCFQNTAQGCLPSKAQGCASDLSAKRLYAKGRRFHVELRYQAKESHHLPDIRGVEQAVKTAVSQLLTETDGDILVFLPGKREIQACLQACQPLKGEIDSSGSGSWGYDGNKLELLALHGGITPMEQKQILIESSRQRVIFSTNVAETSLTIPGVTAVIDSGLERRTHQRNGRTVLSLARISRASCEQRKGRAGRTQDGICIRLWGKGAPLEAMTPPELQREELVEPMLAAAGCGYRLSQLQFVDTIPAKALAIAEQKLLSMGAIDEQGKITEHGNKLSPLPIDTQFAHLISAMPDDECRGLMVDLAAALSVPQRLFKLPTSEQALKDLNEWEPLGCDAFTLIKLVREPLAEFMSDNALVDLNGRKEARFLSNQIRSALQLARLNQAQPIGPKQSDLRHRWLASVIKALPELAFVRREKRVTALGNGYSEVQIGRGSRFCSELKDFNGKESALAAVVFDQHSIAGKGSKQTLNLASCMVPVSLKALLDAGLGEERLAENREKGASHKVVVETVYAGRVIGSRLKAVEGEQALEAIVRSIALGRQFKGVAAKLNGDIAAWNIWLALGKNRDQASTPELKALGTEPLEFESYLSEKLSELGVESYDDLELIEAEDLLFEGIPEWEREAFDAMYPTKLALAELKVTVEYLPKRKLVTLVYAGGLRKTGPKRWELPRWVGWKIQYRKASRVVDVK
ncbi:putative ATP-dependent helicase [Shewanella sediminis HAW-EB3]|uniref:Putative ATP-dependent helicase n=1 Tax=Shewanella sediminis (strain HAW-EB3) TaxID=425104 RepID=A8G1Y7_SHESH|nr:helicase-related protein [Shewanella sediminis]ABV39110.1 putative ATP-dependent helicase [Shewanella sediminis HAW-EB3]